MALFESSGVSVIVPVYNEERHLNRCVDSILKQTHAELEIILVDDGSQDDSGNICDEYRKKDKRVKVIHKENGGLISAWKAGVAVSSAPFLCFVDSDDWIEPDMVAEMAKHIRHTGKEIVCCNHVIDRETKRGMISSSRKHGLPAGRYMRQELEREVFPCLLGNESRPISMSRCMKLISRKLIEDNLSYCNEAIRMGEDVNIILPAILDAESIVIMEEAYYYHYYFNTASMVHKYDENLWKNIDLLVEAIYWILEDKNIENALIQQKKEYQWLSMLIIKNEIRGNQPMGYSNVMQLCNSNQMKKILKKYPINPTEYANKLIYMVMHYPNKLSYKLLKMMFRVYDSR